MKRAALAAAAGVLLAAAYPTLDLGFLAWLAPAPLVVLAITSPSRGRAALEGFLFGLVFQGVIFTWWFHLLRDFGQLSVPEAGAVFLLLAAYLGSYAALFAAALSRTAARFGAGPALAAAPAIWCATELARSRLLTGVPWALLGDSQHAHPLFIQVADLGGVLAAGVVVASGASFLSWGWLRLRRRGVGAEAPPGPAAGILLAAVPLLAAGYGAVRLSQQPASAGSLKVGLVQGNVAQAEKWAPEARNRILSAHLEATREAAGEGAALVVWPESSVPLPLTSDPTYRTLLQETARRLGIDLLVGSVHFEREPGQEPRVFNSAFLLSGEADPLPPQRYDKIKLVPFGEYVPLRRFMGPVEKLVEEASDFSSGTRPVVMRAKGALLAPLVCYEAIFPDLARRFVAEGAELIVNITNDNFLGTGAGPRQHLAFASLRAVENRRWFLRAANTGISAVVDPWGRVVERTRLETSAVIVHDTPLLRGLTFYARFGDVAGWACAIVALAAVFFPGFSRSRTDG